MPRNSSGIYTLPPGNPVVDNTLIETSWANPTMNDIATALTGSLPRDGSAAMTGPLILAGQATQPLQAVPLEQTTTKTSGTGSSILPASTTGNRDLVPQAGFLRFNTTIVQFEGYNGTDWSQVGGGATGGGVDQVFYNNSQHVTVDYTIPTGKNSMSAGPIIVDDGITVTVPNGSVWSIV